MDTKKRVVDETTGKLALERSSSEYGFLEMYGSVKPYGAARLASHGIFPGCHNYPPDRDASGNLIDYSLQKYGGSFARKQIRTETVVLPEKPELASTGSAWFAPALRNLRVDVSLRLRVAAHRAWNGGHQCA